MTLIKWWGFFYFDFCIYVFLRGFWFWFGWFFWFICLLVDLLLFCFFSFIVGMEKGGNDTVLFTLQASITWVQMQEYCQKSDLVGLTFLLIYIAMYESTNLYRKMERQVPASWHVSYLIKIEGEKKKTIRRDGLQ